ncbi:hypothetical protein NL676_004333 [Syzygium grande]|nr:hypothetical protein NL676_004333 [Syzygium grande]
MYVPGIPLRRGATLPSTAARTAPLSCTSAPPSPFHCGATVEEKIISAGRAKGERDWAGPSEKVKKEIRLGRADPRAEASAKKTTPTSSRSVYSRQLITSLPTTGHERARPSLCLHTDSTSPRPCRATSQQTSPSPHHPAHARPSVYTASRVWGKGTPPLNLELGLIQAIDHNDKDLGSAEPRQSRESHLGSPPSPPVQSSSLITTAKRAASGRRGSREGDEVAMGEKEGDSGAQRLEEGQGRQRAA